MRSTEIRMSFFIFLNFGKDNRNATTNNQANIKNKFGFLIFDKIHKMMIAYIFGSISIAFAFSVVGLLINNTIKNTSFYKRLSNFNFISSEKANRYLGVLYFRQILIRSFWRHLNPALKLTERPDRQKLQSLRNEMTYAEISHLFAFLLVAGVAIASKVWHYREQGLWALIISNIVFHLYPALVQQYNKRRLDRIIKRSNA